MKVSIEKLPQAQIELDFEIPTEELDKFIEKATLELSQDISVQGFRKGKAPKEIAEKEIGQERILALAVDKANRLDKMNLHLTACEIDKEYIDKAIKRISESIKQGTLSF